MPRIARTSLAFLLAALAWAGAAQAGGDAAEGAQQYRQRCTLCHAVDTNNDGPAHRGVYGRRAGMAPDFDYSPALRRSGIVWDENSLDAWLTDPDKLVPGQGMDARVPEARVRADLVAYLRTLTAR